MRLLTKCYRLSINNSELSGSADSQIFGAQGFSKNVHRLLKWWTKKKT